MEISNLKEAEKFMRTAEIGDTWYFSGWPDPITEGSLEEYDKLEEAARTLESEIFDYIANYVPEKEDDKEQDKPTEDVTTKRTIRVKE